MENNEFTFGGLEVLLRMLNTTEGPLARMKADKDLPITMKAGIYKLVMSLSDSSEIKAYLEQKQDMANAIQNGERTEEEVNKEFNELLGQTSGFSITAVDVPEKDALRILSVDEMLALSNILNFVKEEKEDCKRNQNS